MKKSLGRTVKGLSITLHSVGAIFKYMKSNITGDKDKVEDDGSIKMNKMPYLYLFFIVFIIVIFSIVTN